MTLLRTTATYLFSFILLGLLSTAPVLGKNRNPNWVEDYITPVPDFPKAGVTFQWYAPLLQKPKAFKKVIKVFTKRYKDYDLDAIAALDSRGFIFGAVLAHELKVPLVLIRKEGKLPGEVERVEYELEYGTNSFEIETSSLAPGARVLIVDDVVATGGTAEAASILVERLQGEVVEVACLIELPELNGQEKLKCPIFSLLKVNGE